MRNVTSIAENKRKYAIWVTTTLLYSSETYNLEDIFPIFKNLPEGQEQRWMHHGFQSNGDSSCSLCNAYKLKRLTIRSSSNSSYDSFPSENWSESEVENEITDSRNFSIQFKNQKRDSFRNIEAWRKNIMIEKTNQNEDEQWGRRQMRRKKIFQNSTRQSIEIELTLASRKRRVFWKMHIPAKEIYFEFKHFLSHSLSDDEKWNRWKF